MNVVRPVILLGSAVCVVVLVVVDVVVAAQGIAGARVTAGGEVAEAYTSFY